MSGLEELVGMFGPEDNDLMSEEMEELPAALPPEVSKIKQYFLFLHW